MKTPKQLKDYYIRLILNTLSDEDYDKELIRIKYIISCIPKPKRTEIQADFVNFIEKNIYEQNTTFAYVKRYTKGVVKTPTNDEFINFFGSYDAAKVFMQKSQKEAGRRIDSYFEKHRIVLNRILNA
jgi:hypothetical protein